MPKLCVFCFLLLTCCRADRYVPFTPCPKVFNYFESLTSLEIIGAMTFKNDLSGRYDLKVNMSIPTVTDKNIYITRTTEDYETENGESIEYYVHFPYNHTFPKLTSITFNGKLYCVGPPEEVTTEHGVTPLSARHFFITKIVDSLKETSTTTPYTLNHLECGTNMIHTSQSTSGNTSRSGEYPWVVAIFLKPLLGTHNIRNWAIDSTLRAVKSYYVHPDYSKPADADIAVLLLDEPVIFNVTIRAISPWDESDWFDTFNGTIVGWGTDKSGVGFVAELNQIQLPIVSEEECLRSDVRSIKLTSSRTFCAGTIGEPRGSCSISSGSGFFTKMNEVWKLRGFVIYPISHICDVNNYVVFTDVPKYTTWLKQVIEYH